MIITPGPSSLLLGQRVAALLDADIVPVENKLFPDGESYIRFMGDLRDKDLVIVHSCDMPQDKRWMELLFMVSTAKDLGARKVVAVVPYFGYSRQDRRLLQGEAIASEIMIKLLEAAGIDYFMTFDIHNKETLTRFKVGTRNLSAMPAIGKYFLGLDLRDPFVVTPDDEDPLRAKTIAEILSTDWSYFGKDRDPVTGEITTHARRLRVGDRDVVIVDDVISTGKTMLNAILAVKQQGARDVYLACAFPLLVGNAEEELFGAGAKAICGTDCVQSKYSTISVAPIIVDAVKSLLTS